MIACATTYSVTLYSVTLYSSLYDLIEVFRRVVYEVPGPRPKLALGSPDPAEPETERMRPAPARQ